jgi:hypothetical protein
VQHEVPGPRRLDHASLVPHLRRHRRPHREETRPAALRRHGEGAVRKERPPRRGLESMLEPTRGGGGGASSRSGNLHSVVVMGTILRSYGLRRQGWAHGELGGGIDEDGEADEGAVAVRANPRPRLPADRAREEDLWLTLPTITALASSETQCHPPPPLAPCRTAYTTSPLAARGRCHLPALVQDDEEVSDAQRDRARPRLHR